MISNNFVLSFAYIARACCLLANIDKYYDWWSTQLAAYDIMEWVLQSDKAIINEREKMNKLSSSYFHELFFERL